MRWAARLCFAAAVVCGVLAVIEYRRQPPDPDPDPPWAVSPTTHDLGTVKLGEHVVAFELTNPAAKPRRIVGLNEG